MRRFKLLDICLDRFNGGEGVAAATAQGAGGDGNQGGSQAAPGSTHRGNSKAPAAGGRKGSGEYQNVLFGKQPEAGAPDAGEKQSAESGSSEVKTTSNTLEEKQRAYRQLVEGEYKDQYTQDTQQIINRRFRETKNLQDQLGKQQPVIDMLMQRYKIADGDMTKLTAALENDSLYFTQAAEEAGMSVEAFKQMQKLQRDNAALRQAQMQAQTERTAQQMMQRWATEAEQMKGLYPGFDLNAESANPNFVRMLKSGVPVQTAYEVIHMEEIKAGVARMQAKATEKQVVDGIRARGARPQENGVSSQSAFTVKDDVSKLSKTDRREIARRAARGERIEF